MGVVLSVVSSLHNLHGRREAVVAGEGTRLAAPVAVTLLLVALCGCTAVLLLADDPR